MLNILLGIREKTRDHTIRFSMGYEYTCTGELLLFILLSSSKRVLYFDVVIQLNIESQYIFPVSLDMIKHLLLNTFVEIQSVFFYNFRTDWKFLIKVSSSDPSFNRNILRSLYLKFKTSAHAQIAITYYYVSFPNFLP